MQGEELVRDPALANGPPPSSGAMCRACANSWKPNFDALILIGSPWHVTSLLCTEPWVYRDERLNCLSELFLLLRLDLFLSAHQGCKLTALDLGPSPY